MATSKRKGRRPRRQAARPGPNAIELLKAEHRQVEQCFGQFAAARSSARKRTLAQQICQALKVHTRIEEEIFYPAFLAASGETSMHHEAEVEHQGAKRLIADIESGGSGDDYFDARVTVLSEMIRHHVREEEKPGGMFAQARRARMDLRAIGERLRRRRAELMSAANESDEAPEPPERRSRPTVSAPREGVLARLAKRVRGE